MAGNLKFILVGVGGPGMSLVEALIADKKVEYVWGVDWGNRPENWPVDAGYFELDEALARRLYVPLGDANYERDMRRLADCLLQHEVRAGHQIVVVADLGGSTGAYVTPVLVNALNTASCRIGAVVSTPFPFIGPALCDLASSALAEIELRVTIVRHVSSIQFLNEQSGPIDMAEALSTMHTRTLDALRDHLHESSEKET